jgi:chemotaxis signal transduction protein
MLPRRQRSPAPRRRTYVAFAAGGRRWLLPVEQAASVGELGPVARLPTADPRRLGVVWHGGRVVALLDPEAFSAAAGATAAMDGGAPGSGRARHLILLRAGGGAVALPAEELLGLKVEYGSGLPEGFSLLAVDGAPLERPGERP